MRTLSGLADGFGESLSGEEMKNNTYQSAFSRFAKWTARMSGHPMTFGLALLVILTWAVTGPIFHFSDTWQLVINTGTTIITFLMVFLIQNTQNRDAEAMQLKLDELIRAMGGAKNAMLDLEELEQDELDEVREGYQKLANAAHRASERRSSRPGQRSAAKKHK
jgi:low affinity Fe/Cu permease